MAIIAPCYQWMETLVLLVILIAVGVGTYSGLEPAQRRQIRREAGLEQLRNLELAHKREHKHFFDFDDPVTRLEWKWLEKYEWEVGAGWNNFKIEVRADLDGAGQEGIWRIDHKSPYVQRISED